MRYIRNLVYMVVSIIGITTFYACGNDDSGSNTTVLVGMATVEKLPQNDVPYLVQDNGSKMWVVQSLVPYRNLKSGERIFGSFTLLQPGNDGFNYNVRLNDYTMVVVQDVIDLNVDNVDSIGNNRVQIRDIWPAADYLNVRFMLNYPGQNRPIINLVFNQMIPLEYDGYAHLEIRYNNNGNQSRLVPGLVSFNLGEYGPSNATLKGLKVLVNPLEGGEKTYTFSYPLKNSDIPTFEPIDIAELK